MVPYGTRYKMKAHHLVDKKNNLLCYHYNLSLQVSPYVLAQQQRLGGITHARRILKRNENKTNFKD